MLELISIRGFKSIRDASLELRRLNVLIGANGAGKSNLLACFDMLREIALERLQQHVAKSGDAHSLLYFGPKQTKAISMSIVFEVHGREWTYSSEMAFAASDSLFFTKEHVSFDEDSTKARHTLMLNGHDGGAANGGVGETGLVARSRQGQQEATAVKELLESFRVYHFHDTSAASPVRCSCYVHDNRSLNADAGNLSAVLNRLRETAPSCYRRIVGAMKQIAPWFDGFAVEPLALNPNQVMLNWRRTGAEGEFGPHQLSDGTVRAMALVTLLLLPDDELPPVFVLDEPELGLHPAAITVVAALIRQVAVRCQVIVATQSVPLLDQFDSADVVVVEATGDGSRFERLDSDRLGEWLEEYSLGELWQKNVLGGGPF